MTLELNGNEGSSFVQCIRLLAQVVEYRTSAVLHSVLVSVEKIRKINSKSHRFKIFGQKYECFQKIVISVVIGTEA